MSNMSWNRLHPITRKSIERAAIGANAGVYPCGCQRVQDKVRLCQYHDGMDTGLDLSENEYYPETPRSLGTEAVAP